MRKNIGFFILLFGLFIPEVYAFTYDFETELISDTDKSLYEIKVSLKDIDGTDKINTCSLNISFYEDARLNSSVKSLGDWNLTTGKNYTFSISEGVNSALEMFVIPVEVSGEGRVEIVDIECSDGKISENINNKSISLKYIEDDDNINTSNCDLSNIKLSEGTIIFSADVTEYSIEVSDVENLIIDPIMDCVNEHYYVNKSYDKIEISVSSSDGSEKIYTINVIEKDNQDEILKVLIINIHQYLLE